MKVLFTFLFVAFIGLLSCKKECTGGQPAACSDVPPTNEACQAYFQRWFYDAATNSCTQIGYSGCSQKGFATQAECEACKCD